MIRCLMLVLGVGSALGGVSIQMPYLHPAGVTYSDLSAAVPAIPSHLQYNAATTSSVAYGNAAFLGRTYTPGAISYAAAPLAHIAAPVAHVAAPVVPTVHHLPAVAQVPVAKYQAQPAVIQNLVDVAKPKLATRKIEIRRPAIQKEFYDVEERVVIRPAGSAVVELDQPVSKSQRGPTVVQPAVHAVHSTPVVGFRTAHGHHHIYPSASYPASVSVHPYPIQGPAVSIPVPSTPAPPQEIEAQPEEIPQQPEQFQEQVPQQQPEQFLEQAPQQEAPQFPQQIQQQEPQQFDDSDSVAIDNPEIARARQQQPQPQSPQEIPQIQNLFRSFQQQPNELLSRQQQQQQDLQQQFLRQFQAMTQLRAAERQQEITRSQVQAQEQVVAQLQAQAQSQQAQLQRSEQLLQIHQRELDRSRQAVETVVRSQSNQPSQTQSQPSQSSARAQSEESEDFPGVGPSTVRSFERITGGLEAADIRSALINNIARSSSSPSIIPSVRITPEQSLSNQERFIALLTARGGVVEARSQGQSSDTQVRARVLSVTPAPERAAPREEKVNTRRIVFSRPIQTVEEVDVVEPFTKIERVAVHSPAVIKTAHLGVAHVPTSVPVHGYAHALPTAIPAY